LETEQQLTNRQGVQDTSFGENGMRNFGTDDFGYRGVVCLHRIELGTTIKAK
jgi:hypothetical protein